MSAKWKIGLIIGLHTAGNLTMRWRCAINSTPGQIIHLFAIALKEAVLWNIKDIVNSCYMQVSLRCFSSFVKYSEMRTTLVTSGSSLPTKWVVFIIRGGGGVSQNLSSVTNDSCCYKLLKSLLLIGYQQIVTDFCHLKKALWNGPEVHNVYLRLLTGF